MINPSRNCGTIQFTIAHDGSKKLFKLMYHDLDDILYLKRKYDVFKVVVC